MKTLNLKVVMAAIVAYSDDCHSHSHSHSHNLDSTTNCEPMMLWFHSNKDLDWIKAQINEDFTLLLSFLYACKMFNFKSIFLITKFKIIVSK